MPHVFIPPLLRPLAGGVAEAEIEGTTVRQIVDGLEARWPGLRERLCDGDALKPGLTVAVDGCIAPLGLLQKVGPQSEIHFLPAVGGG